MGNPFKKMEKQHRASLRIDINWGTLPNERSIEVPWLLKTLKALNPSTMLDVGFAGSFYQNAILDLGIEYVGADFDMSRITGQALYVTAARKAIWRELIKRFEWLQEDIVHPSEELMQRSFDVVASISTVEHIVPAGYASNYEDFHADLRAVANMKALVKEGGSLLLSFPVGQTAYFFNPDVNKNVAALRKLPEFKEGVHDQMFYNADRIDQIVDDWVVEEKRFYRSPPAIKEWSECSEQDACSVIHHTSAATTVCLLHLRRP